MWRRTKSPSAYWFFSIRYGGLGVNIPVVVYSFKSILHKVCIRYDLVHQIFMLATQLLVSVIMILRIYALYGRSARVLWWLIGVSSCFIGVAVLSLNQPHIVRAAQSGLILHSNLLLDLAVPWECLFVFDSMIFGMTIYNAYITRRRVGQGMNMPLHRLLLRDGALYFASMALANLANIVTFFVSIVPYSSYLLPIHRIFQIGGPLVPGALATAATCMSVVMMSRLMLNLHEQTDDGVLTEFREIQDEIDFTTGGDEISVPGVNDLNAMPIPPADAGTSAQV
ncbi:hypothetical protein DFH09DRAFT_1373425 [Mycena vulgaris]|nr:hypothetical protein DFH09DRAFT_1373425 [Mycena vulgaris]